VRAWWVYWLSIAIAAVLWVGVPLVLRGPAFRSLLANPVWLVIFVAPLVVAGLDLVLFRETHEEVCRLEARRHRWLRALVGDGYSATTFMWTGVAVLALAVVIVGAAATGVVWSPGRPRGSGPHGHGDRAYADLSVAPSS
jgi:hypothetical protein